MDIQVTGTSIECSFKGMLVLDTWLSMKDSKPEVERWRRVFQALTQLLPDVENFIADDLENRVTNLCIRFLAIWKQVSRKHSRMVSKYGDWLNEIEVCVLPTCATAESHDTQRPAAKASTSTYQHQHRKDFEECSKRSQRRRLTELSELSEEAAESCNKLVKQFRRDNTRKMSRVVTNTNLIHRLLLNSDPYISGLRRLPRKKKSILSEEVLNLLSV